ncbi:hypothetical protein ES708_32532 [subsurface metagenome]
MAGIKRWTDGLVAEARRLAAEGRQTPEIARRMSQRLRTRITAGAIQHLGRRFGIRFHPGPPAGNRNWKGSGGR